MEFWPKAESDRPATFRSHTNFLLRLRWKETHQKVFVKLTPKGGEVYGVATRQMTLREEGRKDRQVGEIGVRQEAEITLCPFGHSRTAPGGRGRLFMGIWEVQFVRAVADWLDGWLAG